VRVHPWTVRVLCFVFLGGWPCGLTRLSINWELEFEHEKYHQTS